MSKRPRPLLVVGLTARVDELGSLTDSPPRLDSDSCRTGRLVTDNAEQLVRVYHYILFICRVLCQLCQWMLRPWIRAWSADARVALETVPSIKLVPVINRTNVILLYP